MDEIERNLRRSSIDDSSDSESDSSSESSYQSSSSSNSSNRSQQHITDLGQYSYDTFPFDGSYRPGVVQLSSNELEKDPDLFQLVRILQNPEHLQRILKASNLRPTGTALPDVPLVGHPVKGDYFGICSELKASQVQQRKTRLHRESHLEVACKQKEP